MNTPAPHSVLAAKATHVFDAGKFAKLIREKDRKSGWQRFMDSVQRRKEQIHTELLLFASRKK